MPYQYSQETVFSAYHTGPCARSSAAPSRHAHTVQVKAETRLESLSMEALQTVTLYLNTFDRYVRDSFEGVELQSKLAVSPDQPERALADYFFNWLAELLPEQLHAVTVTLVVVGTADERHDRAHRVERRPLAPDAAGLPSIPVAGYLTGETNL